MPPRTATGAALAAGLVHQVGRAEFEATVLRPMDHGEFSRSGLIGNPMRATPEKGEMRPRLLPHLVRRSRVPPSLASRPAQGFRGARLMSPSPCPRSAPRNPPAIQRDGWVPAPTWRRLRRLAVTGTRLGSCTERGWSSGAWRGALAGVAAACRRSRPLGARAAVARVEGGVLRPRCATSDAGATICLDSPDGARRRAPLVAARERDHARDELTASPRGAGRGAARDRLPASSNSPAHLARARRSVPPELTSGRVRLVRRLYARPGPDDRAPPARRRRQRRARECRAQRRADRRLEVRPCVAAVDRARAGARRDRHR